MPARPLQTDLTAITTLGLVAERPRHPYEMQRLIRNRGKSFVKGLPRSLYHAIDRLAKEGLVEIAETTGTDGGRSGPCTGDRRRPRGVAGVADEPARHTEEDDLRPTMRRFP